MAEPIKEQPRNLTEQEVELIQAIFDEPLLKTIRALMFGLGISDSEKTQIKTTFSNSQVMAIMYRRFYPTLDRSTPIGQIQDIWLGVEQMINGMPEGAIFQAINYKDLALQYTRQSLDLLKDPNGKPVNLEYSPKSYPNDTQGVFLMARNQFLRHVEQQLLFLWYIVQTKPAKPEEIKKKKAKDSAQ